MANIGSVIQIGNRHYRIGRVGDLRLGSRFMIGYTSHSFIDALSKKQKTAIYHRIYSPSEMKNAKSRHHWQPAFGTIVSIKKHPHCRGFRIAEITGIPGEVLIGSQGRCLHEVDRMMIEIDEEVAS